MTAFQCSTTVPAPGVAVTPVGALSEPVLAAAVPEPVELKYAHAALVVASTTSAVTSAQARRLDEPWQPADHECELPE